MVPLGVATKHYHIGHIHLDTVKLIYRSPLILFSKF